MARPARSYTEVEVTPANGDWQILLDGRPVKTTARHDLLIPSARLAQAIAAEWRAQEKTIAPETMPLTRLLNIAIDRVPADREALLAQLVEYGATDLLCYRAPDPALAERQRALFDPVLNRLFDTYGIEWRITRDVMPIAQPAESLARLNELFAQASNLELAALSMLVPLLGSALLGLALWQGHLTLGEALAAAHLDEAVQAEQWGEDPHEQTAWAAKTQDIRACAYILLKEMTIP
jgi:chaperone required for assembly of F1-ATPase